MDEDTGRKGVFNFLIIGVVVVLLGAAVYYLFFAPAPLIEVIVPSELKSVSKISETGLNTPGIFNSPVYKTLRQYVAEPVVGDIGRANPFSPWTIKR